MVYYVFDVSGTCNYAESTWRSAAEAASDETSAAGLRHSLWQTCVCLIIFG